MGLEKLLAYLGKAMVASILLSPLAPSLSGADSQNVAQQPESKISRKAESQQEIGLFNSPNGDYSTKLDVAPRAIVLVDRCRTLPDLVKLYEDTHPASKYDVVFAIGNLWDPRTVDVLSGYAYADHPFTRHSAAVALGKAGNPKAIEPLIQIAKEIGWENGWDAIKSLREYHDPEVTQELSKLLNVEDEVTRICGAAAILAQISDFESNSVANQTSNDKNLLSLQQKANEEFQRYLQKLKDTNSSVRSSVAYLLGYTTSLKAIPHLEAALNDPDKDVRMFAAQSIRNINRPKPKYRWNIGDTNVNLREFVASMDVLPTRREPGIIRNSDSLYLWQRDGVHSMPSYDGLEDSVEGNSLSNKWTYLVNISGAGVNPADQKIGVQIFGAEDIFLRRDSARYLGGIKVTWKPIEREVKGEFDATRSVLESKYPIRLVNGSVSEISGGQGYVGRFEGPEKRLESGNFILLVTQSQQRSYAILFSYETGFSSSDRVFEDFYKRIRFVRDNHTKLSK